VFVTLPAATHLLQLRQVEKEAKHDVKDRAGRRYHRLEQSVVWLLVVSCMLAALEVGKKAMSKQDAAAGASSSSGRVLSSVAVQVDDGADSSSYQLVDIADAAGLQDDDAISDAAVELVGLVGDAAAADRVESDASAQQQQQQQQQQQDSLSPAEQQQEKVEGVEAADAGGGYDDDATGVDCDARSSSSSSSSSSRPNRSWWRVWKR
jgi:hypothetical protein